MNTYNELIFSVDECQDLFIDIIFSFGIDAIEQKDEKIVIRSENDLEDVIFGIQEFAKSLENIGKNINLQLTQTIKQNRDWIEEYRKNIQPIEINDFYIHTTWQESKPNKINIIIDPALAFGSGHHESTYSCLQFIEKYAQHDMKAIDVGCGSGILSIALSKLGLKVDACDTDSLAIDSLLKNAKINSVCIENSWVGSIDKHENKYDLVVANIIADVILMLQYDLKAILKQNGILILSGILEKYEQSIKNAFDDLILIDKTKINDWISLVYKVK